jgi:hypothetical protein
MRSIYTPTRFGGRRAWFQCLACKRRCRVVYGGIRTWARPSVRLSRERPIRRREGRVCVTGQSARPGRKGASSVTTGRPLSFLELRRRSRGVRIVRQRYNREHQIARVAGARHSGRFHCGKGASDDLKLDPREGSDRTPFTMTVTDAGRNPPLGKSRTTIMRKLTVVALAMAGTMALAGRDGAADRVNKVGSFGHLTEAPEAGHPNGAGLAHSETMADELGDLRRLGFDLPKQVIGFARGRITDNEPHQPGLGYTIAYHGPSGEQATVYVYDLGISGIPDGPLNAAVRAAFDQATTAAMAAAGLLDMTVELVDRYGTGNLNDGAQYLCAEFMIQTNSGTHKRSYLYLTGYKGKFVKIRATVPTSDPTVATAREFADAIASALWAQKQAEKKDKSAPAAGASTLGGPIKANGAIADAHEARDSQRVRHDGEAPE